MGRFSANLAGAFVLLIEFLEPLIPKSVVEFLGLASITSDFETWRRASMWTMSHFLFWLPIAAGLGIIAAANWSWIKMHVKRPIFRLAIVVGVLGLSYFLTGFSGEAAQPSAPGAAPTPQAPQIGAAQGPASEGVHNGPTTNNFYPPPPPPPKSKLHAAAKKMGPFSEACKKAEEDRFEAAASPGLRPLLAQRFIIGQFYEELIDKISPREIRANDPEAIQYYNVRLKETKAAWRVTPENKDQLFGMICVACSADGSEVGIEMENSNGNIFDQLKMDHTKKPFDLHGSNNNSFKGAEINEHPDGLPDQAPLPMPKECQS